MEPGVSRVANNDEAVAVERTKPPPESIVAINLHKSATIRKLQSTMFCHNDLIIFGWIEILF